MIEVRHYTWCKGWKKIHKAFLKPTCRTGEYYGEPIRGSGVMYADSVPTVANYNGFYLYPDKEYNARSAREEGLVRVLYSGYCVYGSNGIFEPGVRAEKIKFPGYHKWGKE
jgi:hypothetical protein